MDMKQLEISKLMDEYQDNEFFPEGGNSVNICAVKGRVLSQAVAAKKRRTPPLKVILLVAALSVGCFLCIAAGFPTLIYHLANGTLTHYQDDHSKYSSIEENDPLIALEDGRLVSLLNGERTDITDLVSESKPYICDCSDPDAEMTYYVIFGGTPDRFGFFQWIVTPDPFTYNEGDPIHEGTEQGIACSYSYHSYWQELDEHGKSWLNQNEHLGFGTVSLEGNLSDPPAWLLTAMDELDIPYGRVPFEDITIIHD